MSNRKFIFLMREFINLANFSDLKFDDGNALVCIYDDIECRIEDGSSIGLPGYMVLLVLLSRTPLEVEKVFALNSDFNLIPDGRIVLLSNQNYYLARNCLIPEHTYQLHNYLNEGVQMVRSLIKEYEI